MRRVLFAVLLAGATQPATVFLGPATVVAGLAAPAPGNTRAQAIAALADERNVEARRGGARELGESGGMDDVPHLVRALRDPDSLVRRLAEQAMWQVWSRSGDPGIDAIFVTGVDQMSRRDLDGAVATFSRIVERRPEFPEGWNKRATVHFLRGDLEKSLADCHEVVKRNPYHFGALSGYGMIYLELHEPERALHYFERALAVNPNLMSVEEAVQMLRRLLNPRRSM